MWLLLHHSPTTPPPHIHTPQPTAWAQEPKQSLLLPLVFGVSFHFGEGGDGGVRAQQGYHKRPPALECLGHIAGLGWGRGSVEITWISQFRKPERGFPSWALSGGLSSEFLLELNFLSLCLSSTLRGLEAVKRNINQRTSP